MIRDFFHRTYQSLRRRDVGDFSDLAPAGRHGNSARPAEPFFVCENLEPRLLLSAIYTVTNGDDAGVGSLRQALVDANANAGVDTIMFDIAGSGIHTIMLTSQLPDITEAVILDATSQLGYAGTPLIELNGAGAGNNRSGLILAAGSGGSTIRGLAINRFGGNGIHITRSSGNLIEYNFIGMDPSGTFAPGNGGDGIELYFNAANNIIRNNVISANARGIAIGIGSTDNDNNIIQANYIGTDRTGTLALGNRTAGITVGFGSINTLIGGPEAGQGNIIAFNGIGIEFRQNSATGHSILGNSIFSNSGLGIDLGSDGVTANDPGDGDGGPNSRQNFPVLTSAQVVSGTEVTILGSFNSTAASYFRIEFFANATADSSGHGQGQRFLGFANVATDGSGNVVINATLTAAVAPGEFISATATRSDSTFSTFTDSSEFALNVVAADAAVHTPSVTDATTDEDTQTTSGLVISRNPADGAEVTHFKITGITNGTLYQNDGTTPITEGSFITFAEGNAGLKFTPTANFSGTGHFTIRASTSDSDAGLGGSTVVATITVNAVNDAPVVNDQSFSVDENAPNGTPVGRVIASDPDAGDRLTYSITAGNTAGAFALDAGTGEITVANPAALDYETYPTFTLTVEVADSGTPGRTASATVTVYVTHGNAAPVVNDQSFSVDENAAHGTLVGRVIASDPDAGDRLTYSITAGNTAGAFALNAETGEITVANPAALDYETYPTFTLTVEVADSGTPGRTASATVTIHLNDRNDAPVVNDQSFSVDENAAHGMPVGRVIASDPDAGDRLRYSITAGNTAGAFALNAETGEITVANPAALDYETCPAFTLTVEVADSGSPGRTASATVTIHLNNRNEAPVVNDQSFSVDENTPNGTPVGRVIASDPDTGDRLTYSITAGNIGGAFALNSRTGEITVANQAALDYETHPTFSVTVRVTDLAGSATGGTVTIKLNGVNEAPMVLAPRSIFTLPAVPLVFRSADGAGVSIRDMDAGAGDIRLEVRVTGGEVTLAGTLGLTFALGDGVDDAIMTLTGTIAAVNAALEGMTFKARPGYVGEATLQVVVDDQGNSGSGGPLLGAGVINVLVGAAPPSGDNPEIPAPPEPDGPEPELPPLDLPEPQMPQPDAEDLNESTPRQPMPQVPTEAPAVPDATTAANVLQPQGTRSDVNPAREPVSTAGTPTGTKSDDSGTPPADDNTTREQAAEPEERVTNHTDTKAASAAITASMHANRAMWSHVESMKGQMDQSAALQQRQNALMVGVATGMSVSFAAGYVLWLLRGGSLLASLLAATPLWKSFDPLPVLASWEKRKKQPRRPGERDKPNGDDEHELDELFGFSHGATPDGTWRITT